MACDTEQLRALIAAATQGPWKACPSIENDFFGVYPDTGRREFPISKMPEFIKAEVNEANAALIVAAVNNLEPLLSTNEALARENERRGDALTRLMAAVAGLSKRTPEGMIFFEASPLDSDDVLTAWLELDTAVKAARLALSSLSELG